MSLISKILPALRPSKYDLPAVIGASKYKLLRYYSNENEKRLAKGQEKGDLSTEVRPLGEKIKETTKTVSYTGIIVVGLGVTGAVFYYVLKELFSSNSPNSIYSAAFDKCKNDSRVEDALGSPIKAYGEETSRRRRTHVSHAVYEKDGAKFMRMRFYIKGVKNKAVVELEMKQNGYGNYECRYLFVQLDDYSGQTFIIEDNRSTLDQIKPDFGSQLSTLSLTQ